VGSGGAEINVKCPFCQRRGLSEDTSGHLALNFSKNKGHCVRCDQGIKDVTGWLKKYHNMPYLVDSRRIGTSIKNLRKKVAAPVEPEYQEIPLPSGCKPLGVSKWGVSSYTKSLIEKGIFPEEVLEFDLHYCPEGKYEGYVIFPFIEDGEVVYWQGRASLPDMMRKINPSKVEAPLGKAHWLYRRNRIPKGSKVYLVEGSLDDISAERYLKKHFGEGHYPTSLQGTALSFPTENTHPLNSQFGQLMEIEPSEVCVLFDPDAKRKADSLAELLNLCGVNAYSGDLITGDPNEVDATEFIEATKRKNPLEKLGTKLLSLKPR
jgi:hypothetical protein